MDRLALGRQNRSKHWVDSSEDKYVRHGISIGIQMSIIVPVPLTFSFLHNILLQWDSVNLRKRESCIDSWL